MPDPEVPERPVRRRFTAEYKLRIVEEAMRPASREPLAPCCAARACTVATWLTGAASTAWALSSLTGPRGRPKPHPLAAENERLRREVGRLSTRLTRAERIIEIQRKVSEPLGIPLAQSSDDDESGS